MRRDAQAAVFLPLAAVSVLRKGDWHRGSLEHLGQAVRDNSFESLGEVVLATLSRERSQEWLVLNLRV